VVECGATRVMMDCGFASRRPRSGSSASALARQLAGIVVTHEHDDHMGVWRVRQALRDPGLPHARHRHVAAGGLPAVLVRYHRLALALRVEALLIDPIPVPHDAREPVQYTFSDGAVRLGVVTDLGCITQHVVDRLSGCEALVVECNHDLDMLMTGPYPVSLKQRVSGRFGHLSNVDAGYLVACLDRSRLRHLIAAHLSQQNNRAELARRALAAAACCTEDWIGIATQADGFAWRDA
jgi:phosphoribosyl 1,2-cyclic phosphodiesterase